MAKIKRNIKQAPLMDRVAAALEIAAACSGNPNASTMTTVLATLATKASALSAGVSATQAAFDTWQSFAAAQGPLADDFNLAFDAAADAALVATGGDIVKIQSLGFSAYNPGGAAAIGILTQVLNLVATTGDFDGQVDLSWDTLRGASHFEVQWTTTPGDSASWHHAMSATKSSCTVSGLMSGTKYWFRVAAVGAAGQGPWSDPAVKMAA